MQNISFYPEFIEAKFKSRPNRFIMNLDYNGNEIKAYVPNTGRMAEFCVKDRPFFISPVPSQKLPYKVFATKYQNEYVFLDTVKVNDLFAKLLDHQKIPAFQNMKNYNREVTIEDSRFDFVIHLENGETHVVEVKSCTLCHNTIAMFPDAPTERGQKHIRTLEKVASENLHTHVVFLILNNSASRFYPNFHTDYEYGKLFLASKNVDFSAYKIYLPGPNLIDLDSCSEVPVDWDKVTENCIDKGSYLLLLENPSTQTVSVGKLGEIKLDKGYYIYVGSGMNGLESRVKRHYHKRKKIHWHIDYLTPLKMKIKKHWLFRGSVSIESILANQISAIADKPVADFGATDCSEDSHLFYFSENPEMREDFKQFIFDFLVH